MQGAENVWRKNSNTYKISLSNGEVTNVLRFRIWHSQGQRSEGGQGKPVRSATDAIKLAKHIRINLAQKSRKIFSEDGFSWRKRTRYYLVEQ